MATANFFAPGSEYELAQQDAMRQRQVAEALRAQSQQPMQGGMAGGVYVAPSITQGLAKLLQGYTSGKLNEKADQGLRDARSAYDARSQQETGDFIAALRGTPGTPAGEQDNGREVAAVPGTGPDTNRALMLALKSQNPAVQGMGQTLMSQLLPKAPKWTAFERPDGKGGFERGFVDSNSPNPIGTFQSGGAQPAKAEFVNGQAVNPFAAAPGTVIPKQADAPNPASDLLLAGPDGRMVPNQPLVDVKTGLAKAGKPSISVDARNYNTQESEQSKVYGKQLGEMRGAITQAGFDAPAKLAQLARLEELLAGVDGGKAAPLLSDIASVAQSAGIKLDPKLGVKEAAEAVAREMAGSFRKPGTGPMTDKDFDNFLRQVPDLSKTAAGRAQITKTMRAAIERDQRASQHAREYARQNGGVIDDNYFDSLAKFYAQNPVVSPAMPPTNSRGAPFKDAGKEARYQEWLKSQGR